MNNPYYNQAGDIYAVSQPQTTPEGIATNGAKKCEFIAIVYSKGGSAYAFHGYSNTELARATGYGYCKESTALALAISKLFGVQMTTEGQGVQSVIREAAEKFNIKVISSGDALRASF